MDKHILKQVFQYYLVKSLCACMLSCFSHVQLFVTLWMVASQAPMTMGFSRQEYWSGLPCPPPGDLSNPGIKPVSLKCPTLAARSLPLVSVQFSSVAQSCLTLCNPMDCSTLGFTVHHQFLELAQTHVH